MGTTVWLSLQPLEARRLDLPDLLGKQAQSRHLASQLRQRVRRHRFPLWCAQPLELLRGRTQGCFEAADAEPCKRAFNPVANARALADELFAVAARPFGVFLFQARDRCHAAVFPLAAQPAEKGSFQQCRVEPIGLRPAMFTRNGNAVRVDHIGFDGVRPQPAGQPEAVAPRLERDRYPLDIAPGLLRFPAPAMQQLEQSCFVRVQLLCWMSLDSRNNAGDEPARLAHLDYCNQRAILVESGERPAQVIRLWHGAPRRFCCSDDDAVLSSLAHSISQSGGFGSTRITDEANLRAVRLAPRHCPGKVPA